MLAISKPSFRQIASILVLAAVGLTAAPAPSRAGPQEDKAYLDMLARVKRNDRTVDFTALRNAWTRTSFYRPYANAGADRRLFPLVSQKKFEAARVAALALLETNYLEAFAHMALVSVYKQTGDTARREHHLFVARGLVASVMKSGDGASPRTAYKVVSFNEEYLILAFRRARRSGGKALLRMQGRAIDRFEVTIAPEGHKGAIFIDVTPLLARGRLQR